MTGRTRLAIATGLALLTFTVFIQVQTHEFVDFDDLVYIVKNPHVTGGLSWTGVGEAFTTPFYSQWTPLSRISLQLNHEVHGLDPTGYLLTNVALHAASAVLLFFALLRMTGSIWASAFVAAVFAVHPLHVESVAWSSERKDCLSGIFWMLTLLAYSSYAKHPFNARRYATVTICIALGLVTKPMLVTLPCVLLLLDVWPLDRFGRSALVEKIPWLALSAAVCGITFAVQHTGGATGYGEAIPLQARLTNGVESYVIYAAKAFWPTGLSAFYPHPNSSELSLQVLLCAALLVALTLGVFSLRRSRPYLLVGWLWYLGTLVPVIGVVQVGMQARADRFMYLPLIGLSIVVSWGALELARSQQSRRILAAAAIASVAAMATVSWIQTRYWSDSITLFERNLAIEPNSYYAHRRLATLRLRQRDFEQAEFHYKRVFEILPEQGRQNLVRFYLGMADFTSKRKDWIEALSYCRQAVDIDPEHPRANGTLGMALLAMGRHREARPHLELALETHADAAILHDALGQVAEAQGDWAAALEHVRRALELDAALASARMQLAWLLATTPDALLRRPDEALRIARAMMAETPNLSVELLDTLAAAQAAVGKYGPAVQSAELALTLAEQTGRKDLQSELRDRLENYRSREPYIAGTPGKRL